MQSAFSSVQLSFMLLVQWLQCPYPYVEQGNGQINKLQEWVTVFLLNLFYFLYWHIIQFLEDVYIFILGVGQEVKLKPVAKIAPVSRSLFTTSAVSFPDVKKVCFLFPQEPFWWLLLDTSTISWGESLIAVATEITVHWKCHSEDFGHSIYLNNSHKLEILENRHLS